MAVDPQALFSTEDYREALSRLKPRGRVWPTEPEAVQSQLELGLGTSYQRSDTAGQVLLRDAFPPTTHALLPEWESSLGLPEAVSPPTDDDRRLVVLAKFAGPRGPSQAEALAMAALFGVTLTITRYAPFRAGIDTAGEPLYGDDWASTNTMTLSGGDAWARDEVALRLRAMAPAHAVLIINIVAGGGAGQLDFSDPDQSGWLGAI